MLYFDESGYTGSDLINPEQPYFTLASVRLTEDEVAVMKEQIGYVKWGKELHFKSMYSNPQGRKMLEKVFSYPLMDCNHVLPSFANKRYCIYVNIVDMLIETYYHNGGVNLYEGANNLILANGLYYFALLHPNKELIAKIEGNFVTMVREPSVESVCDFYTMIDRLIKNEDTDKRFCCLLSEIPPTIEYAEELIYNGSFCLDLTLPLFSASIQEWYKRTGVKEDVLFDSSEPFYANKTFLERLRDMRIPESQVGYGIGKHIYPLPVGNMDIVESHNEFGIQLADVYASALNFVLTPRTDKFVIYQEVLKKLSIFQSIQTGIAPLIFSFIEKRMKETADIDPLEFLCNHEDDIFHFDFESRH